MRSLGNFVLAPVILGVLFGIGYVLSHDQPNGGLFLVMAAICFGVAVVFAGVAGVQNLGTVLLRRSGRTGREAAVAGLLAISLLMPWANAIRVAHAGEVDGWANPVAWIVVLGTGLPLLLRQRRSMVPGLVIGGVGLAGWLAWLTFQLTRSEFTVLGFPFLPIDRLAAGWYAALLAAIVVTDGLATEDEPEDGAPTPAGVWPFAVVPGLGIARLGLVARGRVWLLAAAFLVVLIQADAYAPQEFAFFGSSGNLPEARSRLPAAILFVTLLLVYLASLWDTRRLLHRLRTEAPKLRLLRGGSGHDRLP